MTLEIMYGCQSNIVLQTTEIYNPAEVDYGFIEARFNRLLQGGSQGEIQRAQAALKRLADSKKWGHHSRILNRHP